MKFADTKGMSAADMKKWADVAREADFLSHLDFTGKSDQEVLDMANKYYEEESEKALSIEDKWRADSGSIRVVYEGDEEEDTEE